MRGRFRLLIGLGAAFILGVPAASPAPTASISVVWAEPSEAGKLVVQRIGASDATQAQRWRLNLDVAVKNSGRRAVTYVKAQVCYPNVAIQCITTTLKAEDQVPIPSGAIRKLIVPENHENAFPVAPRIRLILYFAEQGTSEESNLLVEKSLTVFEHKVAGGGYLFPGKKSDLPEGWYWSDNQGQLLDFNHRQSQTQRFAYDFGVRRWNGEQWTTLHPSKSGTKNSHYLIWDLPVYAMADGWIARCTRTVDDNVKPGVKGEKGGNTVFIVHATREVALYAHLRKGTIPTAICPREKVDITERRAIRVKAGQYLGRIGNSGHSSGPHLHVQIFTDFGDDAQGLPLQYRNVRTRFAGNTWRESKPCNAKTRSFAATADPVGIGFRQLVEPLHPSGAAEVARHGVREPCFQDVVDGIVAAGYRPVWFDGYEVGGKAYVNAVFRPGGGEWLLRSKLSGAAYQAELSNWLSRGYVPTLVETYREGDALRYAFLAEKRTSAGIGAYHGRSAADHASLSGDYQAKGLVPVAMAVVSLKGKLRYTAFWEKRDLGAWRFRSTMTSGEYQAWLKDQAKAGRRLVYVNAYHHDGKARFSAVVSSRAPSNYVARHDLTATQYQTQYATWTGQGRRTLVVTGYKAGKSHRFAALWR